MLIWIFQEVTDGKTLWVNISLTILILSTFEVGLLAEEGEGLSAPAPPAVEEVTRTLPLSPSPLALRQRLFSSQTYLSPTGILLPPGENRISVSQIAIQQLNIGLTDRLQLGVNTSFLIFLGADLKVGLSNPASRVQQALLFGGGILTIAADKGLAYLRYALTVVGSGEKPYFLNLSLGAGGGGKLFNSEEFSESFLKNYSLIPSLSVFYSLKGPYALGGEFLTFFFPRHREEWPISILGIRYVAQNWGWGLGIATLWREELLKNYFIGFPFMDFQFRY